VPMMPARLHAPAAGEKVDLEIRYYGEMPGHYTLYDDDGETFDYEKGFYSFREIAVTVENGVLKGNISAPVAGKPNNFANIRFRKMTE